MNELVKIGKGRMARMAALAMVVALSLPSWAQSVRREGGAWVDVESGTLSLARNVRVTADVGAVTIATGGQAFRYTVRKRSFYSNEQQARREISTMRVSATHDGDSNTLRVTGGTRHGGRGSTEILVEVPQQLDSVRVDTSSGSITVQPTTAKLQLATMAGGIHVDTCGALQSQTMGGGTDVRSVKGDANVRSGGGSVRIGDVAGRLDVNTAGGNVEVGSVESGSLQTGGGTIKLNHAGGNVVIRTVGGSVVLGDVAGTARIETGGGNIWVGKANGAITASTGGGNVELWKLAGGAQVQTGAGAITAEFVCNRGAFGESYLHTAAGDVVIYLNNVINATVRASSELASGRGIQSEFPELRISSEGGDYGPKTMFAEGALNGGGPLLRVRTTIGQIAFRRSK